MNFTNLQLAEIHPSGLILMPEVEILVRYKKSTIYGWIKKGTFPAPVKTDHGSRWAVSEVLQWIAERKEEREGNNQYSGTDPRRQPDEHGSAPGTAVKRPDSFGCENCQFARDALIQLLKESGVVIS